MITLRLRKENNLIVVHDILKYWPTSLNFEPESEMSLHNKVSFINVSKVENVGTEMLSEPQSLHILSQPASLSEKISSQMISTRCCCCRH